MAGLIKKSVLIQRGSIVRIQYLLRGITPSFSTVGSFEPFSGKEKTDENIFIRREEEINKERLRAKSIKDEAQSEIARKILRDELTNHISETGEKLKPELIERLIDWKLGKL